MAHHIGGICGATAFLMFAASCAPAAMADVPKSRCGVISHDVANLNAVDPRRAYWCKSDIAGYLGEGRSAPVTPRHAHWRRWRHHPKG
jgi:hypothetical protein